MILLSFNCRGLFSTWKKLALKHLFKNVNCDVIILQETLGPMDSVIKSLSLMLPGWTFVVLDAISRSGVLAMGFRNSGLKLPNSWGSKLMLGVEVFSCGLSSNLTLINIYGPCQEAISFWNNLFSKG